MVNWLTIRSEGKGFDEIRLRFSQMLEDGRHIFDAAANALLGGTDPETIREDLFSTDARINATEQRIRRLIVVHGTVHGVGAFPSLLVMMSLAKDAERIGDYAKNIFDLAEQSPHLGDEEQRRELIAMKDKVSRLLAKARSLFASEDADQALAFLADKDQMEDTCDSNLRRLLGTETNSAGIALAYRYFKRVTSHAGNIVTSLVMPLDKLDFYDED